MKILAILATLAILAVCLVHEQLAHACSVCGCGDPLVDASDSVSAAVRLRLALDFEHLTATAASDEIPDAEESVSQWFVRPVVVYSPIESLNLVLQVPLLRKTWALLAAGDTEETTMTGLGDVDFGARWFVWQDRNWQAQSRQAVGLSAGTTLPTGANGATLGGMRVDDHGQLGRGAFASYAGLLYAYHRDPWNLLATATGAVHNSNDYGYHYGANARWSVRGDYRLGDRLAVELGLDGRYARRDTIDGEAQENTGGLVLAAAPGVAVGMTDELWLRVRAQLPVATALYGQQTVGPTYFASVQYLMR